MRQQPDADPLASLRFNQYIILVASLASVCTLIFVHYRKITNFRYSTFLINFCMLLYIVFKKNRHYLAVIGRQLDRMEGTSLALTSSDSSSRASTEYNSRNATEAASMNSAETETSWTTVAQACGTRLNALCTDIVDYFKSVCSTELLHLLDIHPSSTSETDVVNNVDLSKWLQDTESITSTFVEKYSRFKKVESELQNLHKDLEEVMTWSTTTASMFEDDAEIVAVAREKVKSTLKERNYETLAREYTQLKSDLNTITKYLNSNITVETLTKCPICISSVKDAFYIPCGHTFCSECIQEQQHFAGELRCPVCNTGGTRVGKLYA